MKRLIKSTEAFLGEETGV